MKILPATLICLILIGCDRNDSISTYSVPKETQAFQSQAPAPPVAADAGRAPIESASITWTDPGGWKRMPDRSLRVATFGLENVADVDFYVSVFGAESGNVVANVNRWEAQLGLPTTPAGQISERVKPVKCSLGEWTTVDLKSPEAEGMPAKAMLAGLLPADGRVWFVKLIGPADLVNAHRNDFESLLQSFTAGEAKVADTAPSAGTGVAFRPSTPPAQSDGEVPATWIEQPPKAMRLASYWTDSTKSAEIVVTKFGTNAFGDLLSNVNRWRAMVELPPVSDLSQVKSEAAGEGTTIYDFAGTANRVRVAMIAAGDQTFFVRLIGPADPVTHAVPEFDAYLNSRKWK